MGVHITFVRAVDLDEWTQGQIDAMRLGGNKNAREYFQKHGITDFSGEKKYKSKAAQLYKVELSKLVAAHRGETDAEAEAAEALHTLKLADQTQATVAAKPIQEAKSVATLASQNPNAKGRLETPPSSGGGPKLVLRKLSSGASTNSKNLLKKKPATTSKLRVNKLSMNVGGTSEFDNVEVAAPPPSPAPVETAAPVPTLVVPAPVPVPVPPSRQPESPTRQAPPTATMDESMAKLKQMNTGFFDGF